MTENDNEIRELRKRLSELERRQGQQSPTDTPETPKADRSPLAKPDASVKVFGGICLAVALVGIVAAVADANKKSQLSVGEHQYDSPVQKALAESVSSHPYDHEAAAAAASPWTYRSDKDPMTDRVTQYACTTSINQVRLASPYRDVSVELCVRQSPRYGLDAIVSLNGDGQIICRSYNDCSVKIRFDDAAQQSFSAAEAADGASNVIFITNANRFIQALKGASTTKIQMTFYRNGDQVIEWSTGGLEWPRPSNE